MRLARIKVKKNSFENLKTVNCNLCLFFILFILAGCNMQKSAPPEPVQQVIPDIPPETDRKVTPTIVEEYARIHQMSDMKVAEFYLTHPDYAKEHPYTPTEEDLAFYERGFLEKMYPEFKELAAQKGFTRARHILMSNPANGGRRIGRDRGRYNAIMRQLNSSGGKGASTGMTDVLLESEPAAVHYREAIRLYKEKRLDDAIKEMEIAVKAKPDAPAILYDLGLMYMEKGDYTKAVQPFRSSLEYIRSTELTKANLAMYPEVFMGACINLGLIYTRVGMYNEAVKVLQEAIQFRPDDLDANYNLGNAYYFMGDMEKAAEQMRKCINLDPKNAEVHNLIGLMYYRNEFYNAALDEFRIAAKLNPNEKQYSYNEGLVLAKLGRNDEANQAFQRASGLEEGEDVRRVFAEQTATNKVKGLYNEGYTAMENLNLTRAIDLFKAVLKLEPDMVEAHINLGVCYRSRGDKKNQIYHFEEAAKLRPDMPDVHYNLGLAYSDAGMTPQAIAEFERAIELKPSFGEAHFKLGTLLYKTKKYTDAIAEFERCLEISPDWFEAHTNLGSCYLKTESVDSAMYHFEKALQSGPNSAEAHYNLGVAYTRAKRYNEASVLFQKALEIDPGYRKARIMLKELEIYQSQ